MRSCFMSPDNLGTASIDILETIEIIWKAKENFAYKI